MSLNLMKNSVLLKNISNLLNNVCISRNLYTPVALGIPQFQEIKTKYANNPAFEPAKKRIQEAVNDDKQSIFFDDLKNFVFALNTDADFDTFFKAYNKYVLAAEAPTNFRLGPQIMRALYVFNNTDLAYKFFSDEKSSAVFRDTTSHTILWTKLYNDGRYNDVVKLFDNFIKNKTIDSRDSTKSFYPASLLKLIVASLYKLNNAESLNKLKEIMLNKNDYAEFFGKDSVLLASLLAINQNDFVTAQQFLNLSKRQDGVFNNIKTMILAGTNKAEDVLPILVNILQDEKPYVKVFPDSLNFVKKAIVASNNQQLLNSFNTVQENLLAKQKVDSVTVESFLLRPLNSIVRLQQNNNFNSEPRFDNNRNFRNQDAQGNHDLDGGQHRFENRPPRFNRQNQDGQPRFGRQQNEGGFQPRFNNRQNQEGGFQPRFGRQTEEGGFQPRFNNRQSEEGGFQPRFGRQNADRNFQPRYNKQNQDE